jgi:hypothetical protein
VTMPLIAYETGIADDVERCEAMSVPQFRSPRRCRCLGFLKRLPSGRTMRLCRNHDALTEEQLDSRVGQASGKGAAA